MIDTDVGITAFKKVLDFWKQGKADSLVEYTSASRVEPIVLIDADCVYLECMSDVQQSLLSIFAGYYLQAVAISTTIGKISVLKQLDKLNPNRNMSDAVANSNWLFAEESYKHALPVPGKIAMEAAPEIKGAGTKDNISTVKELANLSIGKTISVEITDGEKKAMIPVSIRLLATTVPTQTMVNVLAPMKDDTSAKERWHAWKSGRISFVKDLIFCQDLIDAHRKKLMQDTDDLYTDISKRDSNNKIATILSGNMSVSAASNLIVISDTTASEIELRLGGKLSDFKTREKVFKDTYGMILVVIEKGWDRVCFYTRGINDKTELSARDLKSSNKGDGVPIADVLKALSMGSSPRL